MTTFNYQGLEYDEKTIGFLIGYSRHVNRLYMGRVLEQYFRSRWTIFAEDTFADINRIMIHLEGKVSQKLLDDLSGLLEDLRKEVGWTKLDEEAIRYLGIKYFTELPEEDRNLLNRFYVASQQN